MYSYALTTLIFYYQYLDFNSMIIQLEDGSGFMCLLCNKVATVKVNIPPNNNSI